MTISIPVEFEKFIADQIRTGRFPDPQAVVLKALSAMYEADIIDASDEEQLRQAIQLGIEDFASGRSELWDPQAIKANGRRALESRNSPQV